MTMVLFVSKFKKHWHAYLTALIGFLVSLSLFYALQVQEKHYLSSIAQLGTETIVDHLKTELSIQEHLLSHLTSHLSKVNPSLASEDGEISSFFSSHPQFKALALSTSKNKINWITIKDKVSLDKDLFLRFLGTHEEQFRKIETSWISSPFSLSDHQLVFFMIMPISSNSETKDQNLGHLLALIDCSSLIHSTASLSGISFQITVNQVPITQDQATRSQKEWLFETSRYFYSASWEIKAQEVPLKLGLIPIIRKEALLSWITLILGILISLLLARSTALSELLNEKTVVLDKINQDLKNEINNHVQTETSKKNLEKALLQGQKLQAIGTLAGGIAHDFNNLLYAIRGYVELARDELPQEGIIYKNLGKVLEATHRGQDLIAQILTFSRRQQHEFFPLSLKKEITTALDLLRPTVPQTVDIQFKADTEGNIMGNKTQIHQVIVNLINNAVDAMDGEGQIRITLNQISENEIQELKISPLNLKNYCKIEVSDNGHGMDQSTMDRIFEPFFTTKEVGRGTGLGLSTVHSIVKEHLGEIIVNSQIGKGSTFTIFFPERKN